MSESGARPESRLAFVVLVCWCLFLALQWGDPFDETEHAHVAWLMARRSERPIHDFFQHHQPLLWDVLELYYLAGGGPEGLLFGRTVVVGCAVVSFLALRRLSRLSSGQSLPTADLLGLTPLIAASVVFPSLWVARPEPLGTALTLVAVVVWVRQATEETWSRSVFLDLVAGLLFGAALFASPRFLLLGGAFLLFRGGSRTFFPLRLIVLGVGVSAFTAGYLFLRPYSLSDVWFNVDASRVIARIGDGYFKETWQMVAFAASCLGPAAWVGWRLSGRERLWFLIRVGYGLLVLAASLVSTWPYLYAQNLFAPLAWLGLMLADTEGRLDWSPPVRRRGLAVLAAAGCVACLGLLTLDLASGHTVFRQVQAKQALLALLRPGDRVLLSTATHPVCADDVSFYGHPLVDSEDRLPRAVELLRDRWPLPPCDFLADVKRERPAVIDGFVLYSLPESQRQELQKILDEEYEPLTPPVADGRFLLETLFVRRR